ncbi:MAG: amidase [Deltaproteobacteria bacterium]|nr:amidase [Deltaproteobacteria bacterium]
MAGRKVPYDPKTADLLCYASAVPSFLDGSDTPRAYLERCLETIEALEPEVKAFVRMNVEGAREAADAATARYKEGRPLSAVDGMPMAIKDVHETEDMPMEVGSPVLEGWQSGWDGAAVHALRKGGALILGKTVTTEFAFAAPGPTRNPWDVSRTPGGSSSGSAAAVGARMVPAATGTQVRGSVLRPAAYCGAYAIKASYGALNTLGGFPSAPSLAHLGILAGTLEDMWGTAWYISHTAGGDPGHPSLNGEPSLPPANKPRRVVRLETAGWDATLDETKAVFEGYVEELRSRGVAVAGRADDPEVEAVEHKLRELPEVILLMLTYEGRYPLALYADRCPELLSERVLERVQVGRGLTSADYAGALDWCRDFRRQWEAMAGRADAFVTLNSVDAAPVGMPVGNSIYGELSSVVGVPTLNLPLLALDAMPLGVQLLGYYRKDWELVGIGRWLAEG